MSRPGDARSLAGATCTDPRNVEEWLRDPTAGGDVEHGTDVGAR